MIYAAANASFEAVASGFPTGLVGTLGVRILDNQGGTTTARVTAGIVEDPAGSGRYEATLTAPAVLGQFSVYWDDGGTRNATEDLFVTVSGVPSPSIPSGSDLCTLADVRQALELPSADTSRDALIGTLITAASKAIMDDCDREFAPATASATRRFELDGLFLSLRPYDLRSVASMTLHPEGTSPLTLSVTSDYQLRPVGSPSGTYTSIQFSAYLATIASSQTAAAFGYALLDINGAWGFATVPAEVAHACVLTVSSWLRRDITALALMTEGMDLGRGLAPSLPAGFAIPGDARRLLSPYYRLHQFAA